MTNEQFDQLMGMVKSKDLNDVYLAGSIIKNYRWAGSVDKLGYHAPPKLRLILGELRKRVDYWQEGGRKTSITHLKHEQILKLWMDGKLKFRSN